MESKSWSKEAPEKQLETGVKEKGSKSTSNKLANEGCRNS